MKKLLKKIRWRYKMWRRETLIGYTVANGIVYMNVAKTGFFKPLHRQHVFQIDTKAKKWETRHNTPPTENQTSPANTSPA